MSNPSELPPRWAKLLSQLWILLSAKAWKNCSDSDISQFWFQGPRLKPKQSHKNQTKKKQANQAKWQLKRDGIGLKLCNSCSEEKKHTNQIL